MPLCTRQKPINRVSYSAGGSFPFASTNFVNAKQAMVQVYPRPDGETNTYARHRKAYYDGSTSVQYVIPVGVSFGAYPYKYQVIAGPSGLSVGQYYGDTNYGVVTWSPSGSVSGATVTIRVTDQQLNTIDVTWTVSTSSSLSDFIFVDGATGNDSTGTGAIATPFATVSKVMSSTYATRCAYFKNSTYTGTCIMGAAVSPMAVLAYPGHAPVFSMSTGAIAGSGSVADAFLQGVTFDSGQSSATNYRTVWLGGQYDRQTYHNLAFTNPINGTVADDNNTSIFLESILTRRQYIYVKGCSESGRAYGAGGNSAALFVFFTTASSLIEGNTVTNSSAGANMLLKSSAYNNTVRSNRVTGSTTITGLNFGTLDQIDNGLASYNNEFCYNTTDGFVFNFYYGTSSPGQAWAYRNTVGQYGAYVRNASISNGPFTFENNAIQSTAPQFSIDGGSGVGVTNTGTECQGSSGILDGNLLLTGISRTTYLGKRGAEISA